MKNCQFFCLITLKKNKKENYFLHFELKEKQEKNVLFLIMSRWPDVNVSFIKRKLRKF